jgi:hypothetical protein
MPARVPLVYPDPATDLPSADGAVLALNNGSRAVNASTVNNPQREPGVRAIVFLILLAGHPLGDWVAQTDWQTTNKPRSWAALAAL